MGKNKEIEQSFIIDKLTNSIINTISGDSFQTEVALVSQSDLDIINKEEYWSFDWEIEYKNLRKEVYKLHIKDNQNVIQGMLSISVEIDHIFMNLLENAPFNIGKNKLYEGVAGNLVAFACKLSFQRGFEGFVVFTAKTNLIEHYEKTLGAYHLKNQRMIIETKSAKKLVEKYFKNV